MEILLQYDSDAPHLGEFLVMETLKEERSLSK